MVKISGASRVTGKLNRISGPDMTRALGKALVKAGDIIAGEAQALIMQGSASGKRHIASRPGQPPNNDSQYLHDQIEIVQKEPLLVEVSSTAEYSVALEYGTSRMTERPFMRPALATKKAEAKGLVVKAVNHILAGGKL